MTGDRNHGGVFCCETTRALIAALLDCDIVIVVVVGISALFFNEKMALLKNITSILMSVT
jgi:hypothetical protein